MTSLIAVVGSSAIRIVTDAAVYTPCRRIDSWTAKVMTLPHLQSAFTTSGRASANYALIRTLYTARDDIADIVESGVIEEDVAKQGFVLENGTPPEGDPSILRVVIGGWSPRLGLTAWCSAEGRMQRLPTGGYVCSPGVPPGRLAADDTPANVKAAMVDIVMRQRQAWHLVGGVVAMTTIRAPTRPGESATIRQEVLHRFPDRIGGRIGEAGA